MKKCLLVLSGLAMSAGILMAQPANDDCVNAMPMNYAKNEADVVLVSGDTRGALPDSTAGSVCSGSWWYDDVWFSVTMPDTIPSEGIVVKAYFGTETDDVPAVGMAMYPSCDPDATAFNCFSSSAPEDNELAIVACRLQPGQTYLVRVWSGGAPTDFSGTFRIGAFANPESSEDNVLWLETFGDSLNGWTTYGTCANADSNANAIWRYDPNGVFDKGAYANQGVGVSGQTVCDGAVGVDSDFDDNEGIAGNFGAGRCPAPAEYILESPKIDHSGWGVSGISLIWTQGIREYQSDYFVGYRIYKNGAWQDWVSYQVNDDGEFPVNSAHFSMNHQRVFMGGAQDGDSLQIRFVYDANYYYWAIDDVKLIEAPCVDMRSMSNWYAISPAANIPVSQVYPWYPLNDIYNGGACDQNNVNLNCTIVNSGGTSVYDGNLNYGTIPADSLSENANFTDPVDLPKTAPDTYTGTYTVTSDQSNENNDYDFSDNTNSFSYATTMGVYALETGSTRSIAPASSNYDADAPFGYVYGNYFYFPHGAGYKLTSVTWGISNPSDVPGFPIDLILYKWIDANQNGTCESNEREIVGYTSVEFDGTEPDGIVLDTPLENFNDPGSDILLEDDASYLMVVQYRAVDQTSFFLLASDALNYGAVVLSSSQAGVPTYSDVLGISSDGNVEGIDYTLDVNYGWNLVPVIRLNIDLVDAVKNELPQDNIVKLYPNPASDKMYLDMEFTQQMDHVQLMMFDATGKSVFMEDYKNLDHAKVELNVANLIPGSYMMHVNTDKGTRTVPFIVQSK